MAQNNMDPYGDGPEIKHTQTVGARGPGLLQDTVVHETLESFVHEKIVERAVHVKGFGAMGYFQCYRSMKDFTMLEFLQDAGQNTPVTCRFSLAVSTKGTPDTSRNVRGFSTKFYSQSGIFDLLCNHIPVFLVRDAMRFPESIKSFLPSPTNNLGDPNRFWSFVARTPESTHFVTWLYSDVGTIKSLRKIRAYSVNTYVWKNAAGQRHLIKYHWIPVAGEESIDRFEAAKLAGEDPDTAGRDLYDTIEKGGQVQYELRVQMMDLQQVNSLQYDPLDDTKTWSEVQFPLVPVGRLVLNRNPDDYMEQVEKLAFSPANLMEGAEFSNDKMLQGRSFIYWDAQRYRLGPNFRDIPVNYQPNFTPDQVVTSGDGLEVTGQEMRSELPKPDNFSQAGERYQSLSTEQKAHLVGNIASELPSVSSEARDTVLSYFQQASPEMAAAILAQMTKYSK